jgi:hypothetical protein
MNNNEIVHASGQVKIEKLTTMASLIKIVVAIHTSSGWKKNFKINIFKTIFKTIFGLKHLLLKHI